MAKKGTKKWKENIGKGVTKLRPDIVKKLEEAFAIDASIPEACFYAGITKPTYYKWIDENPKLLARFDKLRERLPLKARQNVAGAIDGGNVEDSWKFLERKKPEEFNPKVKIEHSGEITQKSDLPDEFEDLRIEFKKKLKERISQAWKNKKKTDENTK